MNERKKSKPGAANAKPAVPVVSSAKTFKERYAAGKAMREVCPRDAHAVWKPPAGRPDPVQLVLEAEKGRLPDLLPLRHGRMVRSPFTFYRGAALTMASDLASTPATGVRVQCCGDAHLRNFGGFGTPERRIPSPFLTTAATSPCRPVKSPETGGQPAGSSSSLSGLCSFTGLAGRRARIRMLSISTATEKAMEK